MLQHPPAARRSHIATPNPVNRDSPKRSRPDDAFGRLRDRNSRVRPSDPACRDHPGARLETPDRVEAVAPGGRHLCMPLSPTWGSWPIRSVSASVSASPEPGPWRSPAPASGASSTSTCAAGHKPCWSSRPHATPRARSVPRRLNPAHSTPSWPNRTRRCPWPARATSRPLPMRRSRGDARKWRDRRFSCPPERKQPTGPGVRALGVCWRLVARP